MIFATFARYGAIPALALAWLVCAGPAAAQQPAPSAIATAKELLMVKGATAMFDPLLPGNPSLFKEFNEVAAKLRTELAPRRDDVINQIARLYAQRFTEAEMKEIIAFFRSPTGKKFASEEPLVIEQGLQQAETWAKNMSEEVMTRFRAEMKKKGHDL